MGADYPKLLWREVYRNIENISNLNPPFIFFHQEVAMADKMKILEKKDELLKTLDEIKDTLEKLDNELSGINKDKETEDERKS